MRLSLILISMLTHLGLSHANTLMCKDLFFSAPSGEFSLKNHGLKDGYGVRIMGNTGLLLNNATMVFYELLNTNKAMVILLKDGTINIGNITGNIDKLFDLDHMNQDLEMRLIITTGNGKPGQIENHGRFVAVRVSEISAFGELISVYEDLPKISFKEIRNPTTADLSRVSSKKGINKIRRQLEKRGAQEVEIEKYLELQHLYLSSVIAENKILQFSGKEQKHWVRTRFPFFGGYLGVGYRPLVMENYPEQKELSAFFYNSKGQVISIPLIDFIENRVSLVIN